MRHITITVLMALCLVLLSGCLLEESRHTLYIDPDGGVTWRVIRDLVRSDCDGPEKRADEEAEFVAGVDAGEESWSATFGELGARETRVELLRAERPYTVVVQARFAHVEDLLRRMLAEVEGEASVSWEEDGSLRRLRLTLPAEEPLAPEDPQARGHEDREPADPGAFRIALTEGRFVEAVGFRLARDGAFAEPLEFDEDGREPKELLLVWDVDALAPSPHPRPLFQRERWACRCA